VDQTPIVHVGGTNGKGSVCFKLAQALQAAGLKTGLFVSPHISSYRERIVVRAAATGYELFLGCRARL
jgi:dihydrofolate synthase/folylpolyglutamate synthase